jgi:acetyl-CoA carboxylase alpha subunit/acetyl-CoA carboxylase beta subunit
MDCCHLDLLDEWDADLRGGDPLTFPGYAVTLEAGGPESSRVGVSLVAGHRVVLIQTFFEHMGGTMGAATGEKIVRAFDRATELRLPVVAVTRTGGARLQEGMVALIQMGRTAAARRRHAAAGLLMVAVYGSPTTGGVFASWASLADIKAARAGATIGFGGPRVVEVVTGQRAPATSHNAESAYRAGLIDAVVDVESEASWIGAALGANATPVVLERAQVSPADYNYGASPSGGWETVQAARDPKRPAGMEWAAALTTSWTDLAAVDPAIRAGIASIAGQRVMVIAMDRHAHGDGAARPGPAAFRLAQRAMTLAGQLGLPIVTLIDTPGAEPGPVAEADGIAVEIARTLQALTSTNCVTVSVCVGEGGSGGAMALGYTDRAYVLERAVFSVIGPEAAAVILTRDSSNAPAMANALGLTGAELVQLGVIDDVLPDAGEAAVEVVRNRIVEAVLEARVGDRHRRANQATLRWLR